MADTILVASSAWNLAGDWLNRVDFRKSQVIGNMVQGNGFSIGPMIPNHYKNSCALRMRKFLKWSKTDGDFQWFIGMTNGKMPGEALNLTLIRNNIPIPIERSIDHIISADIGRGTVAYWVRAYMNENHRGLTFSWNYDRASNIVTAVLDVGGTVVTFSPWDYDEDALYLYIEYMRDDFLIFWFIYRQGTGDPELDTQFSLVNSVMLGTYYPPIPFRVDNVPIEDGDERYPLCKKAFRKAFGGDFDKVQEKVLENASIDDIDFVYAAFAASFNTKENASKRYIYRYFQYLLNNTSNLSQAATNLWLSNWDADISRPPIPWKDTQWSSIRTGVGGFKTNIRWGFMYEETGSGLLKVDASSGDLWYTTTIRPLLNYDPDATDGFNQRVLLNWQVSPTTWRRLTFIGLQYNNFVYGSQKSIIRAIDAVLDGTKESSFLVPIHEVIFENMPVIDQIQISTSCNFLVFNCYIVDEEEWYETDWFKVIVVVVIIAVSIVAAVVTGGSSLGPSGAALAGFLGGAGLSAVAALIMAAAVEALAGILIAYLITELSVTLFGEKWGPLIGAIVSFIFTFGMSVGSISEAINALSQPSTWIALATATGNGVAGYLQGQANEVAEQTAKMMEEYGEKNAEIQRLYNELNGSGTNGVDLSVITRYTSDLTEKPADFLTRTLVTGSDIVEVTLQQIEDFCRNNLKLAVD